MRLTVCENERATVSARTASSLLSFWIDSAGSREREGKAMSTDALRAVRARIEAGWSQVADARDASGAEVRVGGADAVAWSLASAFALAGKDGIPMNRLPVALRALSAVTGMDSLERWNDQEGRTKQDVLDALDAAIEHVEGGEEG
jgi:hypothetical protein